MKNFKGILIIALVLIVISIPVSAGFWDRVIRKVSSYGEKRTIITTERELAENEGRLVQKESKALTKEEQIVKNRLTGLKWEETVKNTLCSRYKCLEKYDSDTIKRLNLEEYVIQGGENTKKFINDKRLLGKNIFGKEYSYAQEPDFLRIKEKNGVIEEMEIIDAKTSLSATRDSQTYGFQQLCKKAKAKICDIKFAIPKSEMLKNDIRVFRDFACLVAPLPKDPITTVASIGVCIVEIKGVDF